MIFKKKLSALRVKGLTAINTTHLSVFKLLLHIFDDGLAVEADEARADELWMYRMSPHYLTCDLQ